MDSSTGGALPAEDDKCQEAVDDPIALGSHIERYVFVSPSDTVDVDAACKSYVEGNIGNYQVFEVGDARIMRLVTDLPDWIRQQHFINSDRRGPFNPGPAQQYSREEEETIQRGVMFIVNGVRLLDEANKNAESRSLSVDNPGPNRCQK